MNKRPLLPILLTLLTLSASMTFAQNRITKGEHYLFPDSRKAEIFLKTGKTQQMELNYNLLTEEMVFIQKGQYMAISNPETIDSIRMENRKFLPVNGLFYELIADHPLPLLIRHKNKLLSTGKSTGFGTSQTTAVDNISDIVSTGKVYELELKGEFTLMPENSFWIVKDHEYLRFNNAREIRKIFPGEATALKQFLQSEKIDFADQEDVKKVLDFLFQSAGK